MEIKSETAHDSEIFSESSNPESPIPNSQLANQLINYILHLADNNLIMSQRLSEWTGHGPALEQDIAMTNIALDYLGQARNLYQFAAELKANGSTEDSIAYLRDAHEFKNHLLAELPNGDWAQTILKIFFYAAYQQVVLSQLQQCTIGQIAAIAAKGIKEVNYHYKWSSDWVLRLGDGTAESHRRINDALQFLWPYCGELFEQPDYDLGYVDYSAAQTTWMEKITRTFAEANLEMPTENPFQTGGLKGVHTEHLGYILAEMQYLQRVYPNSEW